MVENYEGLDPERIVAGRELWRRVATAIEQLPPAQRVAVAVQDVEGLGIDEVAGLTGLSSPHLRVILHRGSGRLCRFVERLSTPADPHADVTDTIRNASPAAT